MAVAVSSHTDTEILVNPASKPNLADLHDHLDNLWTNYLKYLDKYTSAQNLIQQHMSAGFLSLARANFNSRGGVRRYGKDYYHDRAVASTRARISKLDWGEKFDVDVVRGGRILDDSTDQSKSDSKDPTAVEKQQPSPPATPEPTAEIDATTTEPVDISTPESVDASTDQGPNGVTITEAEMKTKTNIDPLRWFGILVPPDLRKAQKSFALAVEETMGDAINATKRLRELEVEIRRVRKEIRKAERAGG